MEKRIILVGLPGSGKSTLGKAVADALQLSFFDLDELIVQSIGEPIESYFPRHGERAFREVETTLLREFLERESDFVLATGGGAPCFHGNMDLINQRGLSVFLDVPLETLAIRLSQSDGSRPMFRGLTTAERLVKLNQLSLERGPHYNKAKVRLSGNLGVDEVLGVLGKNCLPDG